MKQSIFKFFSVAFLVLCSVFTLAGTATIVSVSDSANDGNGPTNTYDGDLNTRWSSNGAGQWIEYDLGEVQNIIALSVAFFRGDQRSADLIVETSSDKNS